MSPTMSPALTSFAILFASILMLAAGAIKKQLSQKVGICPVCHRRRNGCTCRWL